MSTYYKAIPKKKPELPPNLLNAIRLPARVDYEGASVLLNMEPVVLSVLVQRGQLKPLGNPKRNEQKYFATVMLLRLSEDEKWLHEATRVLIRHWAKRNALRKPGQSLGAKKRTPTQLSNPTFPPRVVSRNGTGVIS